MDLLFALLLSFLPPYFRRSLAQKARGHIVRGALITGFLQIVIVCILYAKGFVDYIPNASIGPAAFLEYFFTWQGLLLVFFFIDAVVRLLAAIVGQAVGTIPLYALAWLYAWLIQRKLQKAKPPLVSDLVEPLDADGLRILSCRPRKNWDKWMTVMYEEKLYEVSGAKLGPEPHPYIYLLRPKPESKVIRGLHRYDPNELFQIDND